MIPIGEAMAEALLESDESTASLSETSVDKESFDDVLPPVPQFRFRNPTVAPLKPRNRRHGNPDKDGKVAIPAAKGANVHPLPFARTEYPLSMQRHVALDCEMVGVGPGGMRSVLARVSIVNFYGKCLLDTFVRVEERVTDFRTHVTGITQKDLISKDAMPFGKCRQMVINLIRNKILVGHALENDLAVLGILHPWHNIRDTSTFYLFQKNNSFGVVGPSRLKDLAKLHLGIDIQKEGQPHCPCEDACAAMALYRKNQAEFEYRAECQRQTMMFNLHYPKPPFRR